MRKKRAQTASWSKKEKMNCEKFLILFFVQSCLERKKGQNVLMRTVLEAYKKWKIKNRQEDEGLKDINVKTFGKLFPKFIFEREKLFVKGQQGLGMRDVAIKEHTLVAPTPSGKIDL